jgi:hypothetical protein
VEFPLTHNFWQWLKNIAQATNLINTKYAKGIVDNAFFMSRNNIHTFTSDETLHHEGKAQQKQKKRRMNETCMLITKERLQARVGHKRVI